MKKNDQIFPGNRLKEMVRRYEQSAKENHNDYFDVDELEEIIEHYIFKKKIKNALNVISFGQKLHPGSVALKTKQVSILMETGENEKALSLIDDLLLIEHDDLELLFLKGEALLALGKEEEAKELFQKISESGNSIPEIYLDIAYIYIERLNFETATHFLEKGFDVSPDNVDIWFELAFCYEQTGENKEAIRIYNKILDADPYSNEAWFNTGQLYFLEEEYEKAAEAFDFAYISGENDYVALLQKAHALFQCDRFQTAIETYREYAELTDFPSFSYVFIGECFEKMEDFDAAKTMYRLALEKEPQNPDAWTGLCICSMEQEQFEESLIYIEEALKIDSNVSEYWIYMAEAYVNLNQNEEALECYLHALAINPEQLDTFVALGNLYLDADDYAKALEYYEKAESLDKDKEAEGLSLLFAITYYKMEKKEEALRFFIDAVAKDAESKELFFEFCPEANEDPNFYEL